MASCCSINSSYLITITQGETSWKDIASDRQKAARSLADMVPAPAAVTTQGCGYETHYG